MYLINITLKMEKVPTDKAEAMFERHREWFGKNFSRRANSCCLDRIRTSRMRASSSQT